MSGDRHLFGDKLPVKATIPDCVTVVPGDLMLMVNAEMNTGNVVSNAVKSGSGGIGYAYPMAAGSTYASHVSAVTYPFLGVAMEDSPHGSTDTIGVATSGIFEFPLVANSAVTVGRIVNAVMPTGFSASSQTTASYQVYCDSGAGVTIGYCYESETGANTIQVLIRTKYGPGGIVENA